MTKNDSIVGTVNVVVLNNQGNSVQDSIESLRSFVDDDQGNELAEKCFLDKCQQHLSNFDEYTPDDISAILDEGIAEGMSVNIMLVNSTE